VDRADFKLIARRALALALTALCTACAAGVEETAGLGIASHDRYDFMTCKEIVGQRAYLIGVEKKLAESAAKAEASPGGVIVSFAAYRSELTQARALLAAANRALKKNGCEVPK